MWAIQNDEHDHPETSRLPLPAWMSTVLELRICKYVAEKDKWESTIQNRHAMGRELTRRQAENFKVWQSDLVQRLVFNKRRKCYVGEARSVNKDCVALVLHLSDEPSQLTLSSGSVENSQRFRLVLLKKDTVAMPDHVPTILDKPIPAGALNSEDDQQVAELEDDDCQDQMEMSEFEAKQMDEEMNEANAPCMAIDDETDEFVYLGDSSDEELSGPGIPASSNVTKVKNFFRREAWVRLDQLGLTDLPRHIPKCSIGYHQTSGQWQGFYPNATFPLSSFYGGSTKRKEEEAILRVIRGILQSHLHVFPKDKVWARQLEKVKNAEATMTF